MSITGKLCPVCNNENTDTASICRHCGARLEEGSTGFVAVSANSDGGTNAPPAQIESSIDAGLIPEEGIGIQAAGETKPLYVPFSKEITIGRVMDAASTPENLLDLSKWNAGTLGVSRQHATIRRTESGYEVIDLTSRNGSWLNAERLVPNRPYPLPSGSQLRIGNMRLVIMYRPVPKKDA